ncbi:hypothetical protein NPIL_211071 [Nephila pilipes]|uniref:Uncharacterized protein n=1 Tax=Nephila pilipes TaxID=299642 RepID=A0A8X6R1R2_NEPPI|nr:hypothetical protein NPIL_211071 [Nephila pilipes]
MENSSQTENIFTGYHSKIDVFLQYVVVFDETQTRAYEMHSSLNRMKGTSEAHDVHGTFDGLVKNTLSLHTPVKVPFLRLLCLKYKL